MHRHLIQFSCVFLKKGVCKKTVFGDVKDNISIVGGRKRVNMDVNNNYVNIIT